MLNGKQKRYLRSLAVNEKALFQIGKDGLTENLVTSLKQALAKREMLKIAVLKSCDLPENELIIDLLASTGSELVQNVGRNIVIYKRSKEKVIDLP